MAESKKYYWLKLKKDFFKRHDIQIIEAMPNGKDYILFYLKLLVESVDHEGGLRFNDTIPYNEMMLSTITNTNVDIVKNAMKMFVDLDMIEVLEDKTIFMCEVKKMLGTESYWAEQKRKQRETKLLDVGQCPQNVQSMSNVSNQEIEIELDKDIDKELNKDNANSKKEIKHKYGEYKHVLLTDKEYNSLITDYNENLIKTFITKVDEYIEQYGKKGYKNYNLTIRKWINRDSKGGRNGSIRQNNEKGQGKYTGFKPKQSTAEADSEGLI